jgi:hypothetical protein
MAVKSKAVIVGASVVGLLVGAVAAFVFMGVNTRKVMALFASAQLQEMAVNAHLIRTGRAAQLLERYDAAIPQNAVQFDVHHRKYVPSNMALWSVQMYYERNPSVPVPSEIKPIFDSLPPRPPSACDVRFEDAADAAVR